MYAYILVIVQSTCHVHVHVCASHHTYKYCDAELEDILKPEYIAPIVAYLCHEDCQDTGGVFEVSTHAAIPSYSVIVQSIYTCVSFHPCSVLVVGQEKVRVVVLHSVYVHV